MNKEHFWAAASEVSSAHNVSVYPPVWEIRFGSIVKMNSEHNYGVLNIGSYA